MAPASIAPRPGNIVIAGCGSFLPQRRVTNDDIERMSGYDRERKGCSLHEWAQRHHGGQTRYWADAEDATSDLALAAAAKALHDARVDASDIDLILVSTFTSDHLLPSSASRVQAGLGSKAKFLQIDAACSGFIDGMWVASGLMRQHGYRCVLLVAGDILSRLSSPGEYLPQTVFGDGAGAVVLTWQDDPAFGLFHFSTGSDGSLGDYVMVPSGGSRSPLTPERLAAGEHHWRLKFHDIKPWALERMSHCASDVMRKTGLTTSDVAWFVPHQASAAIIHGVAAQLAMPVEKVVVTYGKTGNTSGASIPVALDLAKRAGRFRKGDWVVMAAVGAGMAWGALSYRWPANCEACFAESVL
jgi:3-oxoacyl-[acyl-carrier-protein] synthase-3